ncbi:MAG: acyl-CoA dehydrogenase family protein [Planctomycetes bacterium]|nr:acyl-CoA dehydrogenase family protein [Planctomycetota bacterium]
MPGPALESFFFDDVHYAIARDAARVARERMAPIRDRFESGAADEDEAARAFTRELGAAGLLDLCVPEDFGGRFPLVDLRALCVVREALAYESGFADTCFVLQGLGGYPMALPHVRDGSEPTALSKEWLPRVARGEAISAFAVTEPEAGSDLAACSTRARREGDQWILNGEKTFISNAGVADFFTVLARTSELPGAKGLSMIFVPASTPGVRVERFRVIAPHPIGKVIFHEARVPVANLLDAEGGGMRLALSNLDLFRTSVGAAACGFARRALDDSIARVKTRSQFGKPLSEQQLTRAALAEMATDLEAARLLVYRAAAAQDRGASRLTSAVSMAKLFATEAAQRIVDRAVQLHGGLGVVHGTTVERLYRDVRALRIYEGTTEIQKLVIAKGLLEI